MVHETTERDPERIYLEPWPYSPEGESERATGVEYIRADLHDAEIARLTREMEEAREEITRLRAQREADLRAAYRAGAEWTLDRIDEQTARARRALAAARRGEGGE